jgi:hypothetical protein
MSTNADTRREKEARRRGHQLFEQVTQDMLLDTRKGADRLVTLVIASDDSVIRGAAWEAVELLKSASTGDVSVERLNEIRDAARTALSTSGAPPKSVPSVSHKRMF